MLDHGRRHRLGFPAAEKCLYQDGRPANLTPKALDILILLVGQAGELVLKETLMDKVWPGTFVEENNLSQQISALRKLLGDEAIETVPRRGFRFRLPVELIAIAPAERRSWARRSWLALPLAGLGAAGPRRFDLKPSVARMTLDRGKADVQLIWL